LPFFAFVLVVEFDFLREAVGFYPRCPLDYRRIEFVHPSLLLCLAYVAVNSSGLFVEALKLGLQSWPT
tara:strand:+ start:1561 stop:1764 length:204 start_codon:yes stop_codon:yes gene_type:complete